MMERRRKNIDKLEFLSNNVYGENDRRKESHSLSHFINFRGIGRFRWAIAIILGLLLLLLSFYPFFCKDLYICAMYNHFWRYFYIKAFDDAPNLKIRNFYMVTNNTFVLNRASDIERLGLFRERNNNIPFSHWAPPEWITHNALFNDSLSTLKQQREHELKYPYLRESSSKKLIGTAGCNYAHILLLERNLLANGSNRSYLFVFEDDTIILDPLRTTKLVQAPEDADIVYLPGPNHAQLLRAIRMCNGSVRILFCWGSFGYIITSSGAKKLLRYLQKHSMPIDEAFMSWDLRVYLATGPNSSLVRHHYVKKTGIANFYDESLSIRYMLDNPKY